ncbi:MAG: hypothetical protein ACM3N0_00670 [Chloroflexota bacterium]
MKRLLGIGALLACGLLVGGAAADSLQTGNLFVVANGGFAPRKLPRRAFAPIHFKGHLEIRAVDGGIPEQLKQLVIDFDRDGRLSTKGLPICDPELLREATPEEARALCGRAVVGRGRLWVMFALPGQSPQRVGSLLTLFNGPRENGHPTAILQARIDQPFTEVYDLTIPIKKRRGAYRYRATLNLPPIAGGYGAITHVNVDLGRRWRFAGEPRSYISARCSDGILSTNGRLTFATAEEGDTVIESSVDKGCAAR